MKMKTYSRKRIKHQLIENVHNLCRLCLKKPDSSVPIYNGKDSICASLALRIMICVGLQVTREECLPNVICTECYKELERCYSFRKQCEVTYQKLKSHALAVKEKESLLKEEEKCTEMQVVKNEVDKVNLEDKNRIPLPSREASLLEIATSKTKNLLKDNVNMDKTKELAQETPIEANLPESEDPKFEVLLSTVLLQLGIVATVNDKLAILDKTVRTLEIETGNGSFLVELMEEEKDVKVPIETKEIVMESNKSIVNQSPIENKAKDACEAGPCCASCGKRFASRSVLARHMRVHSGERPHACRVCARRFAQRGVMLRHELVHSEQRPHQCAQCPKSFTQRGALVAHAKSHAPPHQRPLSLHRCPHCPKLFLYASGLSRHLRAHSGHVFACSACARPFRDKSSLLRHVRSARHPAA